LTAHGLAFSLIAGQGEKLFYARGREINLVIKTDFDQATVSKLLAEMPFFWIAFACQFQQLPPEHEANGGHIVLFVDLDTVMAVATGLTPFAAADFEIFDDFWLNGRSSIRGVHFRKVP
jgi:hypothetical protein